MTKENIKKAIGVLSQGGIVIFPTDTTFVIGCRMDSQRTVDRLFEIRRRPKDQAVSILVDSLEMAQKYLKPIEKKVKEAMEKYWPGALTIVYNCSEDKVYPLIRAGGETLGVRMPDHEVALELIKGIKVPILGPSANFHGQNTSYKFEDLSPDLLKLVDFILEGQTKNLNSASTGLDCSVEPWKILREGAIKL